MAGWDGLMDGWCRIDGWMGCGLPVGWAEWWVGLVGWWVDRLMGGWCEGTGGWLGWIDGWVV